ncbi:hypothetical protein [Isoptericola sp. NPDC058082]|uniref:hypothetical protein n=1 Tax=Isoptericola sp. NPDC058082 TaxID=3346331 RepID=UPI0036E74504
MTAERTDPLPDGWLELPYDETPDRDEYVQAHFEDSIVDLTGWWARTGHTVRWRPFTEAEKRQRRARQDQEAAEQRERERQAAERERQREEEAARQARVAAAVRAVSPRERTEALRRHLVEQKPDARTDEALVAWECGHTTDRGRYARVEWMVGYDGMAERRYDYDEEGRSGGGSTCNEKHDGEPTVSAAALVAEYQRVAKLGPAERSKYVPSRRGRSTKSKAPKVTFTRQQVWDLLVEHGVPTSGPGSGQNAAEQALRHLDPRPPQGLIREVQRARKEATAEQPGT